MAEAKIAAKRPAGNQLEITEHLWCACGESKSQPYCDGSHRGTSFTPLKIGRGEPEVRHPMGLRTANNLTFASMDEAADAERNGAFQEKRNVGDVVGDLEKRLEDLESRHKMLRIAVLCGVFIAVMAFLAVRYGGLSVRVLNAERIHLENEETSTLTRFDSEGIQHWRNGKILRRLQYERTPAVKKQ